MPLCGNKAYQERWLPNLYTPFPLLQEKVSFPQKEAANLYFLSGSLTQVVTGTVQTKCVYTVPVARRVLIFSPFLCISKRTNGIDMLTL